MHGFLTAAQYDQLKAAHPEYIGYTEPQYKALDALLGDLVGRDPAIKLDRHHIIGRSEYAPGRKQDPGTLFDWSKIKLPATP